MFSKNSYLKSKLRTVAIMLLSVIMALSLFFAAACSDDDDETEKTTSSNDTQTILNGNFEYFSDSDDETYIIYTPNNWSSTTSGSTNYVMNGIIDTSEAKWDSTINADSLAATLNYNNALDDDSDDYDYDDVYVDYNSMKSRDIPYKDTYAGINGESLDGEKEYRTIYKIDDGDGNYTYYYLENDDDDDLDNDTKVEVYAEGDHYYNDDGEYYDKVRIDNPKTHNVITPVDNQEYAAYYIADTAETHGKLEYKAGDTVYLYQDDDGNYYYDIEYDEKTGEADFTDCTPFESHVLMIHNYVNDDTRYGTAQSYSSSTTVTLQPNTAAELSVWVKTDQLIYDRNGSEIYEGRGAYIEVEQTVGGTSVDSLYIENIRTDGVETNNGWVKYTVYVTGCDFAESTITMTVGLGQAASSSDYSEVCEGYAFFDDVKCTVYSTLDKTTYNSVIDAGTTVNSCMLTDEEEDKIFSFDEHSTFDTTGESKVLTAYDAYYYIDLASHADQQDIELTTNTTVDYTRDSDNYIMADKITVDSGLNGYNITSTDKYLYSSSNTTNASDKGYKVNYLTNSIDTSYDVLGIYNLGSLTSDIATAATQFGTESGYDYYSDTIENVLSSYYDEDYSGNALMMLSAYGSAYTATITDTTNFTVAGNSYKIVSFWIKTSNMADYTAASITLYAYQYDEDGNLLDASGNVITDYTKAVVDTSNSATLSVDTTGVTFDAGDDEDIYNGWVQCFFYVENTSDFDVTFEMQVSFGNTTIADTDASDYKSGYLALTNIQILNVEDEDIFDLTSSGTYAASLTIDTTVSKESSYFDSTGTVDLNNIETNITNPSSYTGVNGGSASIVYTKNVDNSGKDARNSNDNSGLINTAYWDEYYSHKDDASAYEWLQLILSYNGASESEALTTLKEMFGSTSVQPLLIANTVRTYLDETETTIEYAAMNYGYLATSSTSISSDSYEIITVKVYVSKGAVAYVYLTESDGTTNDVMTLNLPEYTFWYDYQGNVLDGEPDYDDDDYKEKDHIVYYIRDDGLYEDEDGNLFANLYNYSRMYYDQNSTYYEAGATDATLYEDLDNDTVYYISESEAQKAANGESAIESPHYLVAYDSDGSYTRVFIYDTDNEQFSNDEVPSYHYIITETDEDDEDDVTVSYSDAVSCFATTAIVDGVEKSILRYDNTDASDFAMYAVVDARYDANGNLWGSAGSADSAVLSELGYDANGNYVADSWQTVSFYIHTGDTAYSYTLELWSGARETSGVVEDEDGKAVLTNGDVTLTDDASAEGTFVAFDLSNMTSDESTYADLLSEFTDEIIDAYVRIINAAGKLTEGTIKDIDQNLQYYIDLYNGLVKNGDIVESDYNTSASAYYSYWQIINNVRHVQYYTYTLYDDAGYVPFNAETAADDETGYDYAPGDYEETLVFLSYVTGYLDTDGKTYIGNYVTFVDYSASDVTVDTNIADDTDDDEDEDDDSTFSVWLLVASIVLAVVLIFTMISLLVRDLVKRMRRRKVHVNNRYSGKRKHYIKKLGLTEETPDDGSAEDGTSDSGTSGDEE